MPILIVLVALILILLLGPFWSLLVGVIAALGALGWGLLVLAVPLLGAVLIALGALGWCIFWCINPKRAMEVYQEQGRQLRAEAAWKKARQR